MLLGVLTGFATTRRSVDDGLEVVQDSALGSSLQTDEDWQRESSVTLDADSKSRYSYFIGT